MGFEDVFILVIALGYVWLAFVLGRLIWALGTWLIRSCKKKGSGYN